MNVAIMQPCYLPWRGYFALMNLADMFVHLDHVPLPRGRSFQTRVAVKTAQGRVWLTQPVRHGADQPICHARFADDRWRRKHLATLRQNFPESVQLVAGLFEQSCTHVADFNVAASDRLAQALGISTPSHRSSDLQISGKGSELILGLCRQLGATRYLTGHGARRYLDHESFEAHGIEVSYLDYDLSAYPQPHGIFDPYVTVLDVLQHAPDPRLHIGAAVVPWREFMQVAT